MCNLRFFLKMKIKNILNHMYVYYCQFVFVFSFPLLVTLKLKQIVILILYSSMHLNTKN